MSILGNGGNAGDIIFLYQRIEGRVQLTSCRGTGAPAARNGRGGNGKLTKSSYILRDKTHDKRQGISGSSCSRKDH